MTLSRLWIGRIGMEERAVRKARPRPAAADDPALQPLLDRPDDRLLRDVGLTRAEVLGPVESAWRAWAAWARRLRPPFL